jgi:hypothetical protein
MAPPTAAKKRKTATATASKKPGWIAWNECEAKIVVLDDLEMGRVSLDKSVTAEQLWPRYQLQPEFANVQFDQFKERLKGHRQQVIKKLTKKSNEWEAFLHDMQLHPPATHDRRGRIIFRLTIANNLLMEDIKAGKHNEMDFEQLWLSREEYYKPFEFSFFRRRIYQAVKTNKYHHFLEMKRLTEDAKRKQYTNTTTE